MAKIIEGPPSWTKQRVCRGCRARVEYELGDVLYGVSGMDAEGGFFSECPSCSTQVHWAESDVPPARRDEAVREFRRRSMRL